MKSMQTKQEGKQNKTTLLQENCGKERQEVYSTFVA